LTKSVVEVAFSGSWFCSSLTSRLRKLVELIAEDELDAAAELALEPDVTDETVMADSGRLRRCSARRKGVGVGFGREDRLQMKRTARRFQARIRLPRNGLIARQNLPRLLTPRVMTREVKR
jgi:hypothetical protein